MTPRDTNPACEEFAARLAEWMDGSPRVARGDLRAHAAACRGCRALEALAARGKSWLEVAGEIEPPPQLIHNILVATAFAPKRPTARKRMAVAWVAAAWAQVRDAARQPRLATTAAMAFFSLSMLSSVTGATLQDVRGLHPGVLVTRASRQYHQATAGVVRYYENLRVLHDLEARLWDLREAAVSEAPAEAPADAPAGTVTHEETGAHD